MRILLLLLPYLLIPWALTLVWRKFKWQRTDWIYPFTVLLVFLYPFVLFGLEGLMRPESAEPVCQTPETMFAIGNMLFFLPITLVVQVVLNKLFLKKRK